MNLDLNSLDDAELTEHVPDDLYNGLKEEVEEATRIFLARGWSAGRLMAHREETFVSSPRHQLSSGNDLAISRGRRLFAASACTRPDFTSLREN